MSVSVNQILSDAKKLVNRLRDNDNHTDTIISQAQTLFQSVDAMKVYDEEVVERNLVNELRSRPIAFEENSHIRDLQQENKMLRDTLEEHQSALEFLMSKYRQQITQRLLWDAQNDGYKKASKELQRLADEVCGLGTVMNQAIRLDDVSQAKQQERMSQLLTENRGLKELLEISRSFGSAHTSLDSPADMVDREIQTDNTGS